MNAQPSFAVDAMLGNIAKKLRILGYDTKYHSSIDDEKLISIAEQEDRILLTKDVTLISNANKKHIKSLLVQGNDDLEQLIQLFNFLGIKNISISTSLSYCVSCNGKLEPIEKNIIKNKVPDGVYDIQQNFWICSNCKKIYWEGTHFEKIQEFVSKLNNRLQ